MVVFGSYESHLETPEGTNVSGSVKKHESICESRVGRHVWTRGQSSTRGMRGQGLRHFETASGKPALSRPSLSLEVNDRCVAESVAADRGRQLKTNKGTSHTGFTRRLSRKRAAPKLVLASAMEATQRKRKRGSLDR